MDILVFKTNVIGKENLNDIMPHLNSLEGVKKYSFDFEDVDKVLRIEADNLPAGRVKSAMDNAGYFCEELPD